jgi:transcriptional regulator with XRE-family HTH domain
MIMHYRAKEGISAKELAERIGIAEPTLLKIERGKKPSRLVLAKIANVFGMTYSDLVAKLTNEGR